MQDSNNTVQNKSSNSTINTNTKIVVVLTLCTRILGFVRIGVLSAFFGATGYADILNLVLSVPNNLRKLLAEGALYNAFMPVYSNVVSTSQGIKKEVNQLFIELLVWGGLTSLLIVVGLHIYATPIMKVLFQFNTIEKLEIAVQLFGIVIYFLFFITVVSICLGVLQSHKKFLYPALAPMLMSITTIISMLLFSKAYGVFSTAYGYIIGGGLQLILLLVVIRHVGYKINIIYMIRAIIKKTIVLKKYS